MLEEVLRCDTSPCRLRLSRIALGRCVVERVRASAPGYPDSREVPGTTCFSQPILKTPLHGNHLMLGGFGAFLIDASVIQSGGSQGEELQQRWSLWTEARASCDIHESRHRKFLPLDFLEYWNVHPRVDVGHAIMVLECKDNSQNKKARQDPGWDAEISMRCCHLWQTCVSLHHQRANANVGGTNSRRPHGPISSLGRHGHRLPCIRLDEGAD
jgi:hypothetical protein